LKVRFIYQGNIWLPDQEKVASRLCECIAKVIALPAYVEIEFADLAPNVYGETLLFGVFKNRFRINNTLSPKEIVRPIAHELLHVHQVYLGKLKVLRDGTHVWMGKQYKTTDPNLLGYDQYKHLPWEQDVSDQLEGVLISAVTKT
jgi:hypothetical protein